MAMMFQKQKSNLALVNSTVKSTVTSMGREMIVLNVIFFTNVNYWINRPWAKFPLYSYRSFIFFYFYLCKDAWIFIEAEFSLTSITQIIAFYFFFFNSIKKVVNVIYLVAAAQSVLLLLMFLVYILGIQHNTTVLPICFIPLFLYLHLLYCL